jgi:hypothetical protein
VTSHSLTSWLLPSILTDVLRYFNQFLQQIKNSLKLGHDHFLPYYFHAVIHCSSWAADSLNQSITDTNNETSTTLKLFKLWQNTLDRCQACAYWGKQEKRVIIPIDTTMTRTEFELIELLLFFYGSLDRQANVISFSSFSSYSCIRYRNVTGNHLICKEMHYFISPFWNGIQNS